MKIQRLPLNIVDAHTLNVKVCGAHSTLFNEETAKKDKCKAVLLNENTRSNFHQMLPAAHSNAIPGISHYK